MLKRIVVAAMALVVLAAALPAYAQYNRRERGNYGRDEREPREGWFANALDRTHDVQSTIMDSDRRATDRREQRERSYDSRRRYDRGDRYRDTIPVRRVPLGPYVMSRRYPFDSCGYSWNRRGGCRDYQGLRDLIAADIRTAETERLRSEMHQLNRNLEMADRGQELEFIDETYGTKERNVVVINQPASQPPPVRESRVEQPATQRPSAATLVNLTGCKAHINGEPISINGHMTIADQSKRIFVEVDSPTCDKYLDPIADGVIALKCR